MANQFIIQSRLQLVFITGTDLEGNDVYTTKAFNNMNTEASAEAFHTVSEALISLQQYPLEEIKRLDTAVVTAN